MKNFRHIIARFRVQIKDLPRLRHESHIKIGALVFLITLLSFGIGYLVGRDWQNSPIVIEKVESSK